MIQRQTRIELFTLIAFSVAAIAGLAQTNVSGVLLRADTNRPLAHAIVHAAPTNAAKGPAQVFRTETAWDGSFIFGNLPAGSYRFCVHNMDNHLNPCEWPTVSDIGAVQVSNFDPKLKVRVELGRRVHLRLNDSAGLLSTALANGRKPDVAVLIVHKSGKVWRRVPALGAASAGHFSLLVPNDPSYGFALASADLTVNDHRGAAIADLTFVPFADPLTPEARALLKQRTHRDPEDPAVVIQVAGPKR